VYGNCGSGCCLRCGVVILAECGVLRFLSSDPVIARSGVARKRLQAVGRTSPTKLATSSKVVAATNDAALGPKPRSAHFSWPAPILVPNLCKYVSLRVHWFGEATHAAGPYTGPEIRFRSIRAATSADVATGGHDFGNTIRLAEEQTIGYRRA
jgi:hypothetical protein